MPVLRGSAYRCRRRLGAALVGAEATVGPPGSIRIPNSGPPLGRGRRARLGPLEPYVATRPPRRPRTTPPRQVCRGRICGSGRRGAARPLGRWLPAWRRSGSCFQAPRWLLWQGSGGGIVIGGCEDLIGVCRAATDLPFRRRPGWVFR